MSNYLAADDPLAGILSDGSDDSFFDEPKNLAKKSSLPKTPEKKSVADLFNLSDGKEDAKDEDWLGITGRSKSRESGFETEKSTTSIPTSHKPIKKISFEDDDDILGTLGLGKKSTEKPTESVQSRSQQQGKKFNFEDDDDILGSLGLGKKNPSKIEDAQTKPKSALSNKSDDLFESILGKKSEEKKTLLTDNIKHAPQSKIFEATKVESKPESQPYGVPREGRRGRRGSGGIIDPLGLFSNELKTSNDTTTKQVNVESKLNKERSLIAESSTQSVPIQAAQTITSTPEESGFPDWLGTASKTAKQELTPKKIQKTNVVVEQKNQESSLKNTQENLSDETGTNNKPVADDNSIITTLLTQQKLAHSNIEYQNTAMALQQQESQLLMAIQLKKYEDNLTEMQHNQQELLVKQEHQFNTLLENQFAKQQLMENNMRLQQERINNHIQLLLSQPSIPKDSSLEVTEELKKSVEDENSKLYEKMISSLKQRQHEEVFLLEESYKKQITLLEQTMASIESRLKTELSTIAESYDDKIKVLKEEHEYEKQKLLDKVKEIENLHIEEIKQIRENQNRVIAEIKYEHATVIENIKESKQSETALFNDANNYAQKLDSNIQVLHGSSRILVDMQEKIEKDYNVLSIAREESLKVKEQEITAMRITLDKCRESAEFERAQLLTLVRSLETKLSEQNQNAREERWALQQAAATLTARSAALDRESEFSKASIEREREQLKTLKETLLAEQERLMVQLTEEKLAMSAEKSRIETSSKLILNYDTQRSKAEVDAAIQVAREATELADRERENLQKQQSELESLKRSLKDKERKLTLKENELTQLIQNAEKKSHEGEKSLLEARLIERKYTDRFKELQNQISSLSNREKKLAEEKISLSKERLSIHSMIRQNRRCGLCAADQPQTEHENQYSLDFIHQDIPRLLAVHDPDVLRLRLIARDDENVKLINEEGVL